jgi:hypothetical protein
LAHFATSFVKRAENSAGVLAIGSAPSRRMRSVASGVRSSATIS